MDRIVDILPNLRNNVAFKYTFCVVAFLLALVIRLMLDSYLPPGFPFLTFFPAVILSTLVAGLWPGIVCAVVSGLAALYFFIQPIYSFELNYGGTLALAVYCFVVGIDIGLIHVMTQALEQLRAGAQPKRRPVAPDGDHVLRTSAPGFQQPSDHRRPAASPGNRR